jgi:hypothetical protein
LTEDRSVKVDQGQRINLSGVLEQDSGPGAP